jgi:hypothetical protein
MRRAVDNNGPAAREKTLLVPGSERRLCAARKIFTIARVAAVPARKTSNSQTVGIARNVRRCEILYARRHLLCHWQRRRSAPFKRREFARRARLLHHHRTFRPIHANLCELRAIFSDRNIQPVDS